MPTLLFVLMAMAAGCYLVNIKNREKPVVIMGKLQSMTMLNDRFDRWIQVVKSH